MILLCKRNGVYFYEKNNIIYMYMGEYDDMESDYIGSFNRTLLDAIIAGLTFAKNRR